MAIGSIPEFSTEQLAKAYGSLAQENEKMCSIMGDTAKQKIGNANSSLGMAKGRGENSSIRETKGHGHEIDTIVLLWPIDSPQICCALQYPRDKEDAIYKWIEKLE